MKKSLLLVASALIAVSASRVTAQQIPSAPDSKTATIARKVTITGSVYKVGSYALSPDENVPGLLERAGGVTPSGAPENAFLIRGGVKIDLDFSRAEEKLQNFKLKEGDVVVVPEAKQRIFVLGDIVKPGKFVLKEKEISVVDAIAMAGGILSDAQDVRIGIVRGKSGPSVEWHDWPAKGNDDLSRLQLQSGDGIYVQPKQRIRPESPPSRGGFQLIEN